VGGVPGVAPFRGLVLPRMPRRARRCRPALLTLLPRAAHLPS
jgi:hypothetical protein